MKLALAIVFAMSLTASPARGQLSVPPSRFLIRTDSGIPRLMDVTPRAAGTVVKKSAPTADMKAALGEPVVIGVVDTAEAHESASAQSASWGIMAGGEGVTGAYRGTFASSAALGLLAQFPLRSRRLAFRADGMLHWLNDAHSCPPGYCVSISPSSVVSASVSMVARMNDPAIRWSPYAFGGVAGYIIGQQGEITGFRPNHVGFQGGIGFEGRPDKHTYFIEMRYMGIPPGGVVPVVIGMRF
jgi:hypothetical protein